MTQVTCVPGASQAGSKIGPIAAVAVATMAAPSTASLAEDTARTSRPSCSLASAAKRSRFAGVGLWTRTEVSGRTTAIASR